MHRRSDQQTDFHSRNHQAPVIIQNRLYDVFTAQSYLNVNQKCWLIIVENKLKLQGIRNAA